MRKSFCIFTKTLLNPKIMFKKITGRDVKFFFLGVFAMFVVVILFEWNDFVAGIETGMHSAPKTEMTK